MSFVVDASAAVAAIIDGGPDGVWARMHMRSSLLLAPELMPVEATAVLRRSVQEGAVTSDAAALALDDLMALPFRLFSFAPFVKRVWALRENVTAYDAWYVALAEETGVPLLSLDVRLSRASGLTCRVITPGT